MGFKKVTSPVPKNKKCPSCKGDRVCKTCSGTGELRIIHSRNKGNAFERYIAKQLSEWCGSTVTRSPSSGGWAKTGDVTPKDPAMMIEFPFCVELKNREAWDFMELLTGDNLKTGIKSWWEQVLGDSQKSKKIPLLVFTKKLRPEFAMLWEEHFYKIFDDQKAGGFPRFDYEGMVIFQFKFLTDVPYETVKHRLAKK